MNKNYIKGRAKEYRIKKKYENEGYIVLRTAGSHGFADLIAIKDNTILFIQCKPKDYKQTNKLIRDNLWIDNKQVITRFIVE